MIEFLATIATNQVKDYMPSNVTYLLPASSWANNLAKAGYVDSDRISKGIPYVKLPAHVKRVAADCGGFVATRKWGGYPFLSNQYVQWCEAIGPALEWAAIPDICCEDELTAKTDSLTVRERQDETTRLARLFWEQYMTVPWTWTPTIQGWTVEDYVYHAEQMAPLIAEMQSFYYERPGFIAEEDGDDHDYPNYVERVERNMMTFRVGIGTLCRRASTAMIREIVERVSVILPGVTFHLWGVKLAGLTGHDLPSSVVSVDSAAWNGRFGPGINRIKDEVSAIERQTGRFYKQIEYGLLIALPRYIEAFERRVNGRTPRRIMAVPRKVA